MSGVKSVRVLIGTVGGQGGGVLSDWLVRGLLNAGWDAMSIGLLGLSQRAGTVTYYCEATSERRDSPVRSVFAVPGDVNLILGQELLELGRLLAGGYASDDCVIVGNTARTYTTLEKMPAEDGIYDSEIIVAAARRLAPQQNYLCDSQAVVTSQGLPAVSSNALLLGIAVASPVIDLPEEPFLEAIRASGVTVEANVAAFQLGHRLQRSGGLPGARAGEAVVPLASSGGTPSVSTPTDGVPASARRHLAIAVDQLTDYQDRAYAQRYVDHVQGLASLPGMKAETVAAFARFGALWLAYEDIPRVAQLKTREDRFARVLREHGVTSRQAVVITEYMAPDTEQLLGMLPVPLARGLQRLGRRLWKDFDTRAYPICVQSSSVSGYWTLRLLAALRRWRQRSLRFAEEMHRFDAWLATIRQQHRQSPLRGQLAAEAGRVVKGYGRVRGLALKDLVGFLEEGLSLVAEIEAAGADAAGAGQEALKILAAEAGNIGKSLAHLRQMRAACPSQHRQQAA